MSQNESADRIGTDTLINRGRRKGRRAKNALVAKKKNEATILAAAAALQKFVDRQQTEEKGKIVFKEELIKDWSPARRRKEAEKLRAAEAIAKKRAAKSCNLGKPQKVAAV